jgi:outer membrane protein assembly factor BamC
MSNIRPFRLMIIALVSLGVAGCQYLPTLDDVLPDRRTEYRQSRAMADLEIPPDLTAEGVGSGMRIPGEEEFTTLSAFEQQQRRSTGAAAYTGPDEQWVSVRGSRYDVWPKLREFWQERGLSLDLDDAELGVMETDWSTPRGTAEGEVRDKFKVFAEPGDEEGTTLLFITHVQQRQSQLDNGELQWVDAGSSDESERQVAADMGEFLGGVAPGVAAVAARTSTAAAGPRRPAIPRAEIVNNEDGQVYLSLPNEYSQAWQMTEQALIRSGMNIRSKDAEQGEYLVLYTPPESEQDQGWFSRLAFWRGEEKERAYRVSLTDAGDRTDLTLLDEQGVWQSNDEARTILGMIQRQYEQLGS